MTELPLVIVGCGGHGRVVLDCALAAGRVVAGFLDHVPAASMVDGFPVLGGDEMLDKADFLASHAIIAAMGNQVVRRRVSLQVAAGNGRLATIIHPGAMVSPKARIDAGTIVVAGAIINTGAQIGRFCIVNTNASIDHDCVLADGVQICPGATLAGGITCGEDVFIGSGAVLLPNLRIGDRAVIGAGSVVLADIPADVTVVGNPAIRTQQR